jgi:hypothetical protein
VENPVSLVSLQHCPLVVTLIVGVELGYPDGQYTFACCYQRARGATCFVLSALLVHLPLNVVKDEGNEASSVLESNGEILGVRCVREESGIGYGTSDSKIETIFIVIRIHVVRINSTRNMLIA